MTFIFATQLEDSVIIAADNRSLRSENDHNSIFSQDQINKIYAWEKGIITGAGEAIVIENSIKLFRHIAGSDPDQLPQCLALAKQFRTQQVGDHAQICMTKLLYSTYVNGGAQLYRLEAEDHEQHQVEAIKTNALILWLVQPEIDHLTVQLKHLYSNLRSAAAFTTTNAWMAFYTPLITQIFQRQSQHDVTMSASFDIVFQDHAQCFQQHINNATHSTR